MKTKCRLKSSGLAHLWKAFGLQRKVRADQSHKRPHTIILRTAGLTSLSYVSVKCVSLHLGKSNKISENNIATVKCGGSVMVWGGSTASGDGRLAVVSKPWILLPKHLGEWTTICSILQQDNQPKTAASPPLNGWRKTKWRLWSGLVKVLTWIQLRCCNRTLRRFMLWLNSNNSAKMSGRTNIPPKVK